MLLLLNSVEVMKGFLLSENRIDDRAENKEIKAPHTTNAPIRIKKTKSTLNIFLICLQIFALHFSHFFLLIIH